MAFDLVAFVEVRSKILSTGVIFSGPFSWLLVTEIRRFVKWALVWAGDRARDLRIFCPHLFGDYY